MKPHFNISITVILLSGLIWTSSASAQKLAWKFNPGDNFDVTLEQESIVTTTFNLIDRKIGTRVKLDMSWQVTAVSPSNVATITQTITDISITMTTPTDTGVKTIQVDSTKTGRDSPRVERNMWKQIAPLVGISFDVEMSTNGEIVSVNTSPKTMELLREADSSMSLRQLLTPEGLRDIFGQSVIVIPEGELEGPWQQEKASTTEMGNFNSTQTFTLEGEVEIDGRPLQKISSTMTTSQSPEPPSENVLQSSKGTGELYFDQEGGYFSSSSFENQFKFKRKYRDLAIDTVTQSSITMKVVKTTTDSDDNEQ